jgi:HlyD family secretion protein
MRLLSLLIVFCNLLLIGCRQQPLTERYRQAPVSRGTVTKVVNSTGTVQPVKSVQVGAFVSAPISEVLVDFNSEVQEGDLLAKIDPRLFEANVARDEAQLAHQQADLVRVTALYENARNNLQRATDLRAAKKTFISDQEIDQFTAEKRSLAAQIELANAGIKQAEASLRTSRQNLDYTEIRSPVSGMVIDRKIDVGQTVVAAFQTPTLFVVAPDLKEKIHVYASVDEADIGLIREAEREGQQVQFRVEAYPQDLFTGIIEQIRKSPTTNQNVVTYTVVVATKNPELKLLPGMTANLSFQILKRDDVLRIPNSALRYYPKPDQVREQDREILEGENLPPSIANSKDRNPSQIQVKLSASQTVGAARDNVNRHVWVIDGDKLRAIPVTIGISDARFTEFVSGELSEGQELVTGIKSALGR